MTLQAGTSYDFTAAARCDAPYDGPYTYSWDFDGETGYTLNPQPYSFATYGYKNVSVSATNTATGQVVSSNKSYEVSGPTIPILSVGQDLIRYTSYTGAFNTSSDVWELFDRNLSTERTLVYSTTETPGDMSNSTILIDCSVATRLTSITITYPTASFNGLTEFELWSADVYTKWTSDYSGFTLRQTFTPGSITQLVNTYTLSTQLNNRFYAIHLLNGENGNPVRIQELSLNW